MKPFRPLRELRAQWNRVRGARADLLRGRENTEHLLHATEGLAAELGSCHRELADMRERLQALEERHADAHRETMLALRTVRDDDARARAALWELRETPEYEAAFEDDEPLVSIIITTYNNWPLLRERSLPSALEQTYERLEILVIGDAAPPEAEAAVRSFGDKRLRYVNLPYRGPYPESPERAWYVSGTTPYNTGLALSRGRWIGTNSDDDALRPNYVESLLALAREQRAEVPYGRLLQRDPGGNDTLLCSFPPALAQWAMQCSLFHGGLRFMPLQPTDWLYEIPNDWSLGERMLRIGVRFAMIDEPVVDYYPSSLWTDRLTRGSF